MSSEAMTDYISIITKMLVQLFHLSGYQLLETMSLELDDHLNEL